MSRPRIRTRIHTAEPWTAAPPPALDGVPPLLRLLHLSSPALPIGAFHFSQGLEYAVERGWVRDATSAHEWIDGVAQAGLATLDLPVLFRLHAAWRAADDRAIRRWNDFLIAARETAELRAEDRHLGTALMRVLAEFGLTSGILAASPGADPRGIAHATAFAFACAHWNIEVRDSMQAYAWAWAENQVLAAVKLIPLGQSAGQRMLHTLSAPLARAVERATDFADSDIGVSTLLQSVASGRHETQYSRLFRS